MPCSAKSSTKKNYNLNALPQYALKAVAAGVMFSLSSATYAACDYTAGDDFDGDSIINIQDGAPCDADLQKVTINHVANGDFEAGANYWTITAPEASYTSQADSFDGSKSIEITTTKNNKGLNAPEMAGDGFSSVTLDFWAKAVTVTDHSAPIKIKLILEAKDGSVNSKGQATSDKFLTAILVDNTDDPDLGDDVVITNAAQWTPISRTFNFADIQLESQEAIDAGGETAGTLLKLDGDGKFNGFIKLQIQPAKAGDVILVDNFTLYGDTDKIAMQVNAITDTDDDGLMDDMDPHPEQAYHTELHPDSDFDGDTVINKNDALPYNEIASVDANNDGYADSQPAPLVNAFSTTGELEFTDAEKDNWNIIKFVSSTDALIGDTSYKVNNVGTGKAKTVKISATEQVVVGFWAKTDAAGATAEGEVLSVKARIIDAKIEGGDVFVNQAIENSDLTTTWKYFQKKLTVNDTQLISDTDTEIIFLKPATPNAINLWIDGLVIFTDPDAEALEATTRDSDSDGINDFWEKDDDNDGLLDGEDANPIIAFGSPELPDIDQDGNEDTLDADNDGILDYFEDRTAPIITLNGSNINITIDGVYNELNATATDDTDGDITENIVTSGSVDTATLGEYYINYDVLDAEGNAATTVTRTVNIVNEAVLDTTAPIITVLGDTSVSMIQGGLYTDAGATAADDTDGDVTANITTTGSVDSATVGDHIITYNVSDAAGNIGTASRTISVVAPDTTKPVITIIGDATITLAEGDVYTDDGANATDDTDGDVTASITAEGINDVNTSSVGDYIITYTVNDAAGNVGTANRTISVVDSTKPVITLMGETAIMLAKGDTYTDAGATATDDTDGDISNSINVTGNVDTATSGIYTVTYSVSDAAGNSAETATRKVFVNAASEKSSGGSFSFAGLFLMVGLFARRLLKAN